MDDERVKRSSPGATTPSCGCKEDTGMSFQEIGKTPWSDGEIAVSFGNVPAVKTRLGLRDRLGSLRARLGIRRNQYRVSPGLYGVGRPGKDSPVFVTANYKLSFDSLRRGLDGLDGWILVLDTKGINVWCAAGRGSFGTEEVIGRIKAVRLEDVVSRRKVILPQLGAPGVAAHEVAARTGFRAVYGPVRAIDIPAYLANGMEASPEMRRVKFGLRERAILVPQELRGVLKVFLLIAAAWSIASMVLFGRFPLNDFIPFLGAVLAGSVLVPILLPWIPGRAFALKGWIMGAVWTACLLAIPGLVATSMLSWKQMVVYGLLLPPVSAFLAMNFTGSSTYTSLSGVVKEMGAALPLIAVSVLLGVVLAIVKLFIPI